MGRIILSFLLVFFFTSLNAAQKAEPENSCISCHRSIKETENITIYYKNWLLSPHYKHGVTCDKCHGGDPTSAEKVGAHKEIKNQHNEKSPIYGKNIPETCGRCHPKEFEDFKTSIHFLKLRQQGSGPTCTTCHSPEKVEILQVSTIQKKCDTCHQKKEGRLAAVGEMAHLTMILLEQTKKFNDLTSLLVDKNRTIDSTQKRQMQSELRVISEGIKMGYNWHTFNLENFAERINNAFNKVDEIGKKLIKK